MKQFSIEFNRDYGIDRRTGWTVTWDGCVLSQLQPWLIVAVWKAIAYEWRMRRLQRLVDRGVFTVERRVEPAAEVERKFRLPPGTLRLNRRASDPLPDQAELRTTNEKIRDAVRAKIGEEFLSLLLPVDVGADMIAQTHNVIVKVNARAWDSVPLNPSDHDIECLAERIAANTKKLLAAVGDNR